jgi:hypothetical protein
MFDVIDVEEEMLFLLGKIALRDQEAVIEGVTGRLGVRLLEFSRTRAFWLETVAR